MSNKLYYYDNNTGIDLPVKFGSKFEAIVLLGKTLNEVKDQIEKNALGFCVFTNNIQSDFIVQNDPSKEYLENILDSHVLEGSIEVKKSTMWYSDNTSKNIIINASLDSNLIRTVILSYFNISSLIEEKVVKTKNVTVYESSSYSVYNTRTKKITIKGTRLDLLKSVCDKNPCCVIKDHKGNIVYKSKFGKVTIPNGKPKSIDSVKESTMKDNINGVTNSMIKIYT